MTRTHARTQANTHAHTHTHTHTLTNTYIHNHGVIQTMSYVFPWLSKDGGRQVANNFTVGLRRLINKW